MGEEQAARLIASLGLVQIPAGAHLFALTATDWQGLEAALLATLDTFHGDNPDLPGIGLERLRLQLEPRLPVPAFVSVLRDLARRGEIGLDGAWVRRAGHVVQLTDADEALWGEVGPRLGGEHRFRPPRVRDLAGDLGVDEAGMRRLLKRIGRMGRVDEVAHDHFFLRDTVAEIVEIMYRLAGSLPRGEFTAAQLRDQLDNGRKVAIQILEFYDRHGVTLRRGDLRRLNAHRRDLFGAAVDGGESSPVGRPDFKSGRGREPVLGGFNSHSLPPTLPPDASATLADGWTTRCGYGWARSLDNLVAFVGPRSGGSICVGWQSRSGWPGADQCRHAGKSGGAAATRNGLEWFVPAWTPWLGRPTS